MKGNNQNRNHVTEGLSFNLSLLKEGRRGVIGNKARATLCLILWIFFSLFSSPHAASFKIPEKLVYDLTWAGIKAGTASLELKNDGDRTKIISTARSAQWVSVFYTVDDRVESTISRNLSQSVIGQPVSYQVKLREGRHRRNKEVIFDHGVNRAKYIDHLKNETKEYRIPPLVFDPISAFYHLRTLELMPGKSVYVSIFDSKKVWNVEVRVLRRERIALPVGTFNTVVIKPLMKSEGIFYRKGEILIWLTDDANHIPVRMQTKVSVGHINATLVRGIY